MQPGVLILQVGRFGFDDARARAQKFRFELVPDLYIEVPISDRNMHVQRSQYRLCASIVHVGNSPDSGHYFTLFHDADGRVVLADDNVKGRFMEHGCFHYYPDIYILFYVQNVPL